MLYAGEDAVPVEINLTFVICVGKRFC